MKKLILASLVIGVTLSFSAQTFAAGDNSPGIVEKKEFKFTGVSTHVELSSFAICELRTDFALVDGPVISPAIKSEEFVPALRSGTDSKISEKWRWRPGTFYLTTYKGTVSDIKQPALRWKDLHRRC